MLRSTIAMLTSLLLLACRGGAMETTAPNADGEPTAAPASAVGTATPTEAPASAVGTATPEGAPASIAAAGEGAAAADEGTEPADEGTEPVDDRTVVAPVGTTPAEAQAVCTELQDPTTILSCRFVRGGKGLPGGGRVDVLELGFDSEIGEVKHVYAVLRVPGEYPHTEQMAEERSVPGEETFYRLEPIALKGRVAIFRATETVTTYPNTGDPDQPSGEYDEVAKIVVRCSITDVTCDKEVE